MKKILVIALSVFALMFTACKSDTKANAGAEAKAEANLPKLIVGTNAQFPPFESYADKKIVGFDIDLINAIAAKLNMQVEIKDMDFDGLLPALESNKVDVVIAGMTMTEDRAKNVKFTSPYYTSTQTIITKADNKDIKGFDDLKGKKVGVVLGYVGDLLADKLSVQKVQFNGTTAAIADLQNSKVDAVIIDAEPAKNIAKKNGGLQVVEDNTNALIVQEEYSIAINPKNTELYNKIEGVLKGIKSDGTYDKLFAKYFGDAKAPAADAKATDAKAPAATETKDAPASATDAKVDEKMAVDAKATDAKATDAKATTEAKPAADAKATDAKAPEAKAADAKAPAAKPAADAKPEEKKAA